MWETKAEDLGGRHSCGARISWLQSALMYNEEDACERVANEFPELCPCNPTSCIKAPPPPEPIYCGCRTCTQSVWDTKTVDSGGRHSCGARIIWLQSALMYNEEDACERVANEFPELCLCSPSTCGVFV